MYYSTLLMLAALSIGNTGLIGRKIITAFNGGSLELHSLEDSFPTGFGIAF